MKMGKNVETDGVFVGAEAGVKKSKMRTLKDLIYVPESVWCKSNWIFFGLGGLGIMIWLFIPKTPESEMTPNTYSPNLTIWLQDKIGVEGPFAWFASIYYIFLMMTGIAFLFIVAYFAPRGEKGRMSWMYAVAILVGGVTDMMIYLIFPVAPPIRVEEDLDAGVVEIRKSVLPWSDNLITLKYCAFPSGHIFYALVGYFMCREENFKKMGYFFLINASIFSFIILYLGEHFWFDILGSIILALAAFYPILWIIDKKYGHQWISKRTSTKTESLSKD